MKKALPFFLLSPARLFFLLLIISFLVLTAFPAGAQVSSPLPLIPRLDSRDTVFKQFQQDIEAIRRLLFSSSQSVRQGEQQNLPEGATVEKIVSLMTIYSYLPREGDDLLSIAARCNIPYATLASLNRLSHKEDMAPGKLLLLSSARGIFISETPNTSLERLLFSARTDGTSGQGVLLSIPRGGKTERFRFIPGDDFSPTERIFFLNRGFHYPLQSFQISSPYGPRISPITGKPSVHGGLDLAAPEGTEVYAVRNGTVINQGEDPILGKFIIIRHENNWVSVYGHLSEIKTVLNQELQSAILIGKVGSTGQATGPHLHFELRQNGQTRDPARLLGLFKENAER